MFRIKRRRAGAPATLIGRYLRAGALRRHDERKTLKQQLDRTGWRDADTVAAEAFRVVVEHVYSPGASAVDVPEMVAKMREFFGADGVDRVPQAEGELLIRAARGDEVSVAHIPKQISFAIHSLVFGGLALDMRYDESVLNRIIVHAEREAISQGFTPTPADD